MTQGVSSPSMDGASAEFSMTAPGGAPNPPMVIPTSCISKPITGGNNVTNFTYDLHFWINNPDAPQALEFDLNQALDDTGGREPAAMGVGIGM